MRITLDTAQIRAAYLYAAKKDVRACLTGVNIRVTHGSVGLESTDGHRLLIQHVNNVSGDVTDGNYTLFIPPSAVKKGVIDIVLSILEGKKCAVLFGPLGRMDLKVSDENYPDVNRVLPAQMSTTEESHAYAWGRSVNINYNYLGDVGKVFKLLPVSSDSAVTDTALNVSRDGHSPAWTAWTSMYGSVLSIIMPQRYTHIRGGEAVYDHARDMLESFRK